MRVQNRPEGCPAGRRASVDLMDLREPFQEANRRPRDGGRRPGGLDQGAIGTTCRTGRDEASGYDDRCEASLVCVLRARGLRRGLAGEPRVFVISLMGTLVVTLVGV